MLFRSHHLVSSVDDVAWITNLRGADVEYNPIVLSHLLIARDGATVRDMLTKVLELAGSHALPAAPLVAINQEYAAPDTVIPLINPAYAVAAVLGIGVMIVAVLLIVLFMALFYKRHQWEMKEQYYQELLAKKRRMEDKDEAANTNVKQSL